jgi:hypothetical protein
MKYMFLLYGPDLPEPGTPEAAKVMADWTVARQAMADAGVLIDCAPLQPPEASTTVRVRDGETLLTDGPAAEIKEVFGGFTLIECDGLDDALKWAARVPTALDGKVEIRPLIQVNRESGTPGGPGGGGGPGAGGGLGGRGAADSGAGS